MNLKICSNCVMDTTDRNIFFDENGVCDHCNLFYKEILPVWKNGENRRSELDYIITKIKESSQDKDFDCIMGVSGGIDSSYLLYVMVTEFKLRPLVFHVDAGWNSQVAVNNIEQLVDGLGLDLFTEVINWEEMKDLQRSFFKSGVSHIDTPQDHAFFASMYKFALNYKVNNILTGANYSTECVRNPKEWMYFQSDSYQIKDIHRKFGTKKLKTFPLTNVLFHRFYLPYVKNIKVHRLLDLMEYDKIEAQTFLENNFKFQKYPQKHFESRFTKFYESYWLYEKFGYDTRKVQFSSLILTKQMTRGEALQELKSKPYNESEIVREFNYIADKLGMTKEELQDCFDSENKTYKDYINQEMIYNFGSKISRLVGIEKGGKR